jgi:hypothetical protein
MITKINKFDERKVISYDFDGVLHTDTYHNSIDPIDQMTKKDWTPSTQIHKNLIKEHNEGNKIIVVSSRGNYVYDFYKNGELLESKPKKYTNVRIIEYDIKEFMEEFFYKYNLPIEDIILTNNLPKKKILIKNKVVRHYDDNTELITDLEKTNIEFVYVKKDKIIKVFKND